MQPQVIEAACPQCSVPSPVMEMERCFVCKCYYCPGCLESRVEVSYEPHGEVHEDDGLVCGRCLERIRGVRT